MVNSQFPSSKSCSASFDSADPSLSSLKSFLHLACRKPILPSYPLLQPLPLSLLTGAPPLDPLMLEDCGDPCSPSNFISLQALNYSFYFSQDLPSELQPVYIPVCSSTLLECLRHNTTCTSSYTHQPFVFLVSVHGYSILQAAQLESPGFVFLSYPTSNTREDPLGNLYLRLRSDSYHILPLPPFPRLSK